jgi:hypothetical protein
MTTLLNRRHPYLEIYDPADGTWTAFVGGRLDIDQSNPHYAVVMAEASRNPNIVVMEDGTQCVYCGQTFTGEMAAAALGRHQKEHHPVEWLAAKEEARAEQVHLELKSQARHACDICQPLQEFGSEDQLALHMNTVHAGRPVIDSSGNVTDAVEPPAGEAPAETTTTRKRRPGEVDPAIPAAKPSRRRSG